ncbi:hypothetical protein CAC42_6349 [Sphaceloma murrayae]|uniref:BRCT domain-containing protein n=1 Tax=Sphaceloma murrayae TaxID=2082308 RepID=A0A2K1QMP2_9PEZI|nr:hypothetical protein CAC42_6349 [Sphaceloma murrayae]
MPTTRAMARQASVVSDDKENETVLSLRKKPVRRGTAKTAATKTAPLARKAAQLEEPALSFSTKKNTQVATTRSRSVQTSLTTDQKASTAVEEALLVKPRKHTARPPARPPTPGTSTTIDTQSQERCSTHDVAAHDGNTVMAQSRVHGSVNDLVSGPAAHPSSERRRTPAHRQLECQASSTPPTNHATLARGSHRKSLVGTPMENKTLDLSPRACLAHGQRSASINMTSTDLTDESDDELCGPKTPLHPQPLKASISPEQNVRGSRPNVERFGRPRLGPPNKTFKTPQKKILVYRPGTEIPQTTKVPLKPADSSSPRRPMSVSRGSSVSYVFHPLPKASRVHTYLKGPYQWPVTPSDEECDPIDVNDHVPSVASSGTSSRSRCTSDPNTPGSRPSTLLPQTRERLTQLFASDSDDEDGASNHDEPDYQYFPKARKSDARESTAAADFQPGKDSDESEDDSEDDFDEELSLQESAETSQGGSYVDDGEDVTDCAPQLPCGIFESTPTQTAPIVSMRDIESSPMSDDELAGTPTITRPSNWTATSVNGTLRPRVSFQGSSEQTPQSKLQTPRSRPRLSAFRTPHMRSALEEFDKVTSVATPNAAVSHRPDNRDRPVCIDPSLLLSQDVHESWPRKDSAQIDDLDFGYVAKPVPTLDTRTVSAQMAPFVAAPPDSRPACESAARLSLLLNTEGWVEISQSREDPWLEDPDTTVVIKRGPLSQGPASVGAPQGDANADTDEPVTDDSMMEGSVMHRTTPSRLSFPANDAQGLLDQSSLEEDSRPHYALPTVASDIRRKSMPVLSSQTPRSSTAGTRTAETTVKPVVTPTHFAKLGLDRQSQPPASSSRRQSMLSLTPSMTKPHLLPSSLPRATSSLALRNRISAQSLRTSYPDSVLSPAPTLTPRPRCYTPTQALMALRLDPTRQAQCKPSPPTKTPQRPPPTPASAAFTPHPSAPLQGIVAYVEVYTRSSLPASASFIASLQRLGAKVARTFTESVTHVVFKDGSPAVLAKVRAARREGRDVKVVNSRWVVECDETGSWVGEDAEEFEVDVDGAGAGMGIPTRRNKSFEPKRLSAQAGMGGPVLTPGRGRLSVACEDWADSPIKGGMDEEDRMPFSDEEDDWETPIRGSSRERRSDVPWSVPVRKIRKEGWEGQGRRLTCWEGS